jgi:hypothetical protein
LYQLLEVIKDREDLESELARLQTLERLRGRHADYSAQVAGRHAENGVVFG